MPTPGNPSHSRVLALDVGSKRIGVAVTDALGITAQGLDTIQRQNKRRDLAALASVLKAYDVKEIVVGLPLRLSGAEGTQSEKMRTFAADIQAYFKLPVHLWDERWTSTEANRLLRETDLSIKKRGQAVDRMAAILILQSWMEAHSRATGLDHASDDFAPEDQERETLAREPQDPQAEDCKREIKRRVRSVPGSEDWT